MSSVQDTMIAAMHVGDEISDKLDDYRSNSSSISGEISEEASRLLYALSAIKKSEEFDDFSEVKEKER